MTSHEIAAPSLFAAQRLQGLSGGTVQRQIVDVKEQPHAGRSVEHVEQRAPEGPFMPRRDQRIAQKGVGMLPVLPVRQAPATVETLERERHEAEQRAAPGGARPQHEKSGTTLRIAMGERGWQKPAFAEDIRFAHTLLERLPAQQQCLVDSGCANALGLRRISLSAERLMGSIRHDRLGDHVQAARSMQAA